MLNLKLSRVCCFILSASLVFAFLWLLPPFTYDLEKAKALGMMSPRISANSSFMQTLFQFFVFTVGTPLLSFFLYRKLCSDKISTPFQEKNRMNSQSYPEIFIVMVITCFFFACPDFFWNNTYNVTQLFFEQGTHLFAINSLWHYEALNYSYGSMMIVPAFWVMKLFQPHLVFFNAYVCLLNVMGFLLIHLFLRQILSMKVFLYSCLIFFAILCFPYKATLNNCLLRFTIVFLPLLCVHYFLISRKSWVLFLTSASLFFTMIFSRERGWVCLFALGVVFCLDFFGRKFQWKTFLRFFIVPFLCGPLVILGTLYLLSLFGVYDMAWMFQKSPFVQSIWMGHNGIPFPTFQSLYAESKDWLPLLKKLSFLYAPHFIYAYLGFQLTFLFFWA